MPGSKMSRQAMRCAAGFPTTPKNGPSSGRAILPSSRHNPAVAELQDIAAKSKTLTLLFATKDSLRNNAAVLREFLSGGAAAE